MAKIDTSKIKGFEGMSPEEKLAAIEALDIPEPDYTGYVRKEVFDKTASDLAEMKRKHTALLSEEDKKKEEEAAKFAEMEKELAELRKGKIVSEHKAAFIAIGYDESLAAESAEALVDGDAEKLFANQKAFMEAHDKVLKADLLKATPAPPSGSAGGVDFGKAIAEANARGDMATAAALIREQQERTV